MPHQRCSGNARDSGLHFANGACLGFHGMITAQEMKRAKAKIIQQEVTHFKMQNLAALAHEACVQALGVGGEICI